MRNVMVVVGSALRLSADIGGSLFALQVRLRGAGEALAAASGFRSRMICVIIIKLGKYHCVANLNGFAEHRTCVRAGAQVPLPACQKNRVIIFLGLTSG